MNLFLIAFLIFTLFSVTKWVKFLLHLLTNDRGRMKKNFYEDIKNFCSPMRTLHPQCCNFCGVVFLKFSWFKKCNCGVTRLRTFIHHMMWFAIWNHVYHLSSFRFHILCFYLFFSLYISLIWLITHCIITNRYKERID